MMKALEMIVLGTHGTMAPACKLAAKHQATSLASQPLDLGTDSGLSSGFVEVESVSLAVAISVLM